MFEEIYASVLKAFELRAKPGDEKCKRKFCSQIGHPALKNYCSSECEMIDSDEEEIEQLQKEVERLRTAIREHCRYIGSIPLNLEPEVREYVRMTTDIGLWSALDES